MLDECKGDKFEEVLVSFSTIVLRKVLAAEKVGNASIAKRLALAANVPSTDQQSMLPLAIAHRASLTAVLRRRKQFKSRYSELQRLLDEKEHGLAWKIEQLEAIEEIGAASIVPNHHTQAIKQQFEMHWQGDPRWLDIIVRGGEHDVCDPLLETYFLDIWPMISLGEGDKATAIDQRGLLQDLEERVASQQVRIEHWKAIRDDLLGLSKPQPSKKSKIEDANTSRGFDLNLSRHESVVFDPKKLNMMEEKRIAADRSCALQMTDEYAGLVSSMRVELSDADKEFRECAQSMEKSRNSVVPVPLADHDEVKKSSIMVEDSTLKLGGTDPGISGPPYPSRTKDPSHHASSASDTLRRATGRKSYPLPQEFDITAPVEVAVPKAQELAAISNGNAPNTRNASRFPEDKISLEVLDEDEVLAQEITSSAMNSALSPAKPKGSLADRTRRSMGFSTLTALDEIHRLNPPARPPTPPLSNIDSSPSLTTKSTTLLERTRQSMSLMPSTALKSRKSLYQPRPSKSYPTNQFETPNKQSSKTIVDETTPPEQLFSQEADYASIFKSRPKIALSPTVSPELREVDIMDDINEGIGDEDFVMKHGVSPSMRKTERVRRF